MTQENVRIVIEGDASSVNKAIQDIINKFGTFEKSAKKAKAAARSVGEELGTAGNRAKQYGTQVQRATMHVTNLGYQLNDIGVMLAAGQSPFLLAMQQGTQISQIFNVMSANAEGVKNKMRLLGNAISASFTQILNPISLATIAIIGITAVVVKWIRRSDETAEKNKQLAESFDSVKKSIEDAIKAQEAQLAGMDKFDYNIIDKLIEYRVAIGKVKEEIKKLQELRMSPVLGSPLGDASAFSYLFSITGERAQKKKLAQLQEQLKTLEEQYSTLLKLREENEAIRKEEEYRKDLARNLYGELQKILTNVDKQAEAEAALNRQAEERLRLIKAQSEEWVKQRAFLQRFAKEEELMSLPVKVTAPKVTPPGEENTSSGKRVRGGGINRAELARSQIEALQEQFMTEIELEKSQYQKRLEMLQDFLEKGYLKQSEYKELEANLTKRHNDKLRQMDVWHYGTSLDKASHFFGAMAQITQSGNERMLKISQAFSAIQAFIDAWQAHNKTLASLPFPANIAAAASVLATGLSAVSAIKGALSSGGNAPASPATPAIGAQTNPGVVGPAQTPQVSRTLTLIGDQFNRKQAIAIAEFLNEGNDNGLVIRGA
ncbi:hypothetical protein D6827_00095 [Candidatus Parcubacteria bacterium]|nr:MAG: hypothetical protein D6827_00095 [Candidatus Parcubacteria bacterium]